MSHVIGAKGVRGVVAGVALLVLVGCGLPAPMLQDVNEGDSTEQGDDQPSIDQDGLERFYGQTITWTDCGQDQECASVEVPIDYDHPDRGTVDIALKKHASSSAEGMVLVNPGGPGGSGVELIDQAREAFSPTLLEAKEIVGFDPRGVGQSAPISCLEDDELDEFYSATFEVDTDEGFEDFLKSTEEFVSACEENNPNTIGFVDTLSAARDMDIIRQALGQEKLDYLGFSYGTKLGATYADLFGERVGAFVLDGAMTLSADVQEITYAQVEGFERAYRVYLKNCLTTPQCPFTGSVDDAYDQTVRMLERVSDQPVDSGDPDRPVTEVDVMNAIIIAMYDVATWEVLSTAISALDGGDGSVVKFLSDVVLDRKTDGSYSPSHGAMMAIQCLDYPGAGTTDKEYLAKEAEKLEELSELFGPSLAYGEVACTMLDEQAGDVATDRDLTAAQAPTMVVLGTTGDPATPYHWAEEMVEHLDDAVLVTWEGEGHLAYRGNSCVDEAVDEFLIDGVLPEDGLTC